MFIYKSCLRQSPKGRFLSDLLPNQDIRMFWRVHDEAQSAAPGFEGKVRTARFSESKVPAILERDSGDTSVFTYKPESCVLVKRYSSPIVKNIDIG